MFSRTLYFTILTLLLSVSVVQTRAQTATPTPTTTTTTTPIPIESPQPSLTVAPQTSPTPNLTAIPTPSVVPINLTRIGVDANQMLPLTLNDAIKRALENNNDIEVARNDVRINETTLRSLQGVYDPTFTVTPTFTRNGGARNNTSATNDFSLNAGFSQFLERGGGRIQPFFNNSRSGTFVNGSSAATTFGNISGGTTATTFGTTTTTTDGAFYTSSLGVSFVQPLIRNRSIDNTRRQIRIQRKRLQQSDADFRRRTIETIAQVQRAYWDLVFALRDQQNRQSNLDLTRENLRRVEAQITAGAAAPLARAEVATELANRETDLLTSAQQVSTAENTLKGLLLKESNQPEWTAAIVPTDEPNFDQTPILLNDALTEARANRPELQRLNLQTEINDLDLRYFKNQVKPQIDLNTSLSLNGLTQTGIGRAATSTTLPLIFGDPTTSSSAFLLNQINVLRNNAGLGNAAVPTVSTTTAAINNGGLFNTLGNLFNTNSPTFSVGVTIGFPFRNQTAKADLAGAQIQRTQLEAQTRAQEQTVIAEVRNAVQAVETARQRIATARAARQNAEIQLQGEQKLFDVGRSTTFLLFQRQNALTNARNAEIRAQTDYNKSLADLQRATSTTLQANNIVVNSPVAP